MGKCQFAFLDFPTLLTEFRSVGEGFTLCVEPVELHRCHHGFVDRPNNTSVGGRPPHQKSQSAFGVENTVVGVDDLSVEEVILLGSLSQLLDVDVGAFVVLILHNSPSFSSRVASSFCCVHAAVGQV